MRIIFPLAFLYCVLGYSQSGNYFLSHYSPGQDRLDNVCFQIAQHENGMMYFATRSGIFEFDGRNWTIVPGTGSVYTISIIQGKIFWGGVNGFGKVSFGKQGQPESTNFDSSVRNIFQSASDGKKLYFLGSESVFAVDVEKESVEAIATDHIPGAFTGIFEINGGIYVSTSDSKLFKMVAGELAAASLPGSVPAGPVFSTSLQGKSLVGFGNNAIYLLEPGKTARRLLLEDQEYINRSVVLNGAWVSSELFVIGTLRGGLVFVNVVNGKTYEIINNTTGLPDNEVFFLFTDKSQSIWVGHEFGYSRVVPYLPFRSFNHYAGLQGNLLCAITHQNSVYVGTSSGLYKLEKEDVYEEIRYYVDVTSKGKGVPQAGESDTPPETSQVESKRRGLFGLFRKKNQSQEEPASPKGDPESKQSKEKPQNQRFLKTEKVLRHSNFVYQKVKGIEAKVTQLVEVNGKLLAASLGGTFHVNGLTSRTILSEPSRYLFGSADNTLFISTYADKVHVLMENGSSWQSRDLLVNISDPVNHIFETKSGHIWLCALDKVFRLQMKSGDFSDLRIIPVENPNYDQLAGFALNGSGIVVNSKGIYAYDEKDSGFSKIDSLSTDELTNYFAGEESIWFRDSHSWSVIASSNVSGNPGLLNLFKNIRFINPDKNSGDLWIITGNNELFKFFSNRITPYSVAFPLTLKSVKNGERRGSNRVDIRSEEDITSVTIDVVQPDYLAAWAIEYRYKIKGLDQNWSEWSVANNLIEIPYLPTGDYALLVQSKNIFGEHNSMQELHLNVIPPYWKRPWFYALEVILFSVLVVMSFRLSTRYRIISRLLMLLTIIILIQLVETLIGETLETKTSPVVDFFVQVVIAMLVLPVEGYLRERMLRSLEFKDRFYKFMLPKVSRELEGGPAED